MAIFEMNQNPENGELHVVLGDSIVALSGTDGQLSTNNMVQKVVGKHGKDDPMGIVVRTTHQADRLLPASTLASDPQKVKQLKKIITTYRDRLLTMLDCLLYIWGECKRCNSELSCNNGQVHLPQVHQLNEKVESFLINGKKALAEVSKILSVFFGYQKFSHDYNAHCQWAKATLGENSHVTKVLEDSTTGDNWPKYLIDMRNRVEHQKDNYWLKVQNIEFEPVAKKMLAPAWSTDEHPNLSDIGKDMHVLINNILVMSEDLIATCVLETLAVPCVTVATIPPEQINPDLPLRWGIFVSGLPRATSEK